MAHEGDGAEAMSEAELRSAARKTVNFSVLYRTGLQQSKATLIDISLTGALLESSVTIPPVGAIVVIKFKPSGQDEPIPVNSRVVRYTTSGFAVEFLSLNKATQQVIEGLD